MGSKTEIKLKTVKHFTDKFEKENPKLKQNRDSEEYKLKLQQYLLNYADKPTGDGAKRNVGDDMCYLITMDDTFKQEMVIKNKVDPMIRKTGLDLWHKKVNEDWHLTEGKRFGYLMFAQSSATDPFNTSHWNRFETRYIAALVYHIYPNDKKFHARQMHYHLLQANYCFPQTIYKKNKDGTNSRVVIGHELIRYDGDKNTSYKNLGKYLGWARMAGLIAMDKQVDMRNTSEILPKDFDLSKINKKKKKEKLTLDFNLEAKNNMKIEIEAPVILFYTEKSEMIGVLDELADKYFISYFAGQGFSSIPTANKLYQFIKERSNTGIILTLTDYDESGLNIANSLAAKIHYLIQTDDYDKAPNIVVYPFKINHNDAELFEELGIMRSPKKTGSGTVFIYELVALEMLAVSYGISLASYLENELKMMFFHTDDAKDSWLIERKSVKKYTKNRTVKIYNDLTKTLHSDKIKINAAKLKKEKVNFSEDMEYKTFQDNVIKQIEQLESYKVLKRVVKATEIEENDLSYKKRMELSKKRVDNDFGFHSSPDLNEEVYEFDLNKEGDTKKMFQRSVKDIYDESVLFVGGKDGKPFKPIGSKEYIGYVKNDHSAVEQQIKFKKKRDNSMKKGGYLEKFDEKGYEKKKKALDEKFKEIMDKLKKTPERKYYDKKLEKAKEELIKIDDLRQMGDTSELVNAKETYNKLKKIWDRDDDFLYPDWQTWAKYHPNDNFTKMRPYTNKKRDFTKKDLKSINENTITSPSEFMDKKSSFYYVNQTVEDILNIINNEKENDEIREYYKTFMELYFRRNVPISSKDNSAYKTHDSIVVKKPIKDKCDKMAKLLKKKGTKLCSKIYSKLDKYTDAKKV